MRPVTLNPNNIPASFQELERASHENDPVEIAQNFDVTATPTAARTLDADVVKIDSFTRDLSLPTGIVSYAGVGFRPSALFLVAAFPTGTAGMCSVGFLQQGAVGSLLIDGATGFNATTATAVAVGPGAFANYQFVNSGSMDADGFTLGWNRNGAPVGIATIYYCAIGLRNIMDLFGTFIADLQKGGMNRTT